MEEELNPNSIQFTANLTAPVTGTAQPGLAVESGESIHMMPGTIILHPNGSEYIQITAKTATTVDVIRGYGGTTPVASTGPADKFTVIAEAAQDGADVTTDISRARIRKINYTQIFKKDLIVSGTSQAVTNLGGIGNEFDHQVVMRTREAVRDLEKAVYLSILSGNTIGTASLSRSFQGLKSALVTNSATIGATLTETLLKAQVKAAWDNGATDLDIITADAIWKDAIDGFNATRIRTTSDDPKFRNIITSYESSYGIQRILPPSRWMLPSTLMVLASKRIKVMPLKGRTFQFLRVNPTGDALKGFLLGEYTCEIRNEKGMAQAKAA